MPNYVGTAGSAVAMYPGDSIQLFAAEAPAAGQASISVSTPPNPVGGYSPINFDIQNDSTYTAGDAIQIQGASVDSPGSYQTLQTITTQQGYYSDQGLFNFYRVVQSVRAGTEKTTVTVTRA